MINEMLVWEDELLIKHLPLDPHMSGIMLVQYLKKRVLKREANFCLCKLSAKKNLQLGVKLNH
jgi:hypothetical protein